MEAGPYLKNAFANCFSGKYLTQTLVFAKGTEFIQSFIVK